VPSNRERNLFLFEDLVDRHVDLVFHAARAWSGNTQDAKELTQTAFIKAWLAFDRFEVGTNFKAWVLKILRNAFLDLKRSEASGPDTVPLEDLPSDQEPEDGQSPPRAMDLDNKGVFYDVFGDEVARLLRQMPGDFQLPVLLCDVEGLSYREIAEVLDLPMGTVQSRIHRGRAILADSLRTYAGKVGFLRERRP
jgi:RNA polymerase sigma-70 factor (ECF subfamily)